MGERERENHEVKNRWGCKTDLLSSHITTKMSEARADERESEKTLEKTLHGTHTKKNRVFLT